MVKRGGKKPHALNRFRRADGAALRVPGAGAGFCHPALGHHAGPGPLAPNGDLHGRAGFFGEDLPHERCPGPEQRRSPCQRFGGALHPQRHGSLGGHRAGDGSAQAGCVLPGAQRADRPCHRR